MAQVYEGENTIAESQHLFSNKALQLSERFFPIEDTSLLKVGAFGYQTALAAHMMRDSTFHRNMLYNEFFLTNSKLNSTVYNWAKMLDYDIDLATPSVLPVLLKISIADLKRIATTDGNGNKELVLDRNTSFDVGGFPFMLPYAVSLTLVEGTNNQASLLALYDFTAKNITPKLIKTPYLKTTLQTENGILYAYIAFNIYQIKRKEYIFSILSNDILDAGIIEQNFSGNIVSFSANYSENANNLDVFESLETIFNETRLPKTSKYLYYTYVGDDTLRIHFSNRPQEFRPAFNSKISLEVFTTDAEEGNFTYNGTVNIKDSIISETDYTCIPSTNYATGGSSGGSFNDTKIALMHKLRTRDSIVTSYDLQSYFDTVKKESIDSNSDFKAVKLRDDILRRQFALYILSRNSNGDVLPTNTINIELPMETLASRGYSLAPGTLIVYDRIQRKYRLLDEEELPEAYLKSTDSYLYAIPYLMNIDFKEFPKLNSYLTDYEQTIQLTYEYSNLNAPYEIILNDYSLGRNTLFDLDFFKLTTFINTTSLNSLNVKLRAVLYKKEVAIGYADLEQVSNSSEFSLKINTDDEFDKDGNYLIKETFYDIDTNELIPNIKLDGDYLIKIGVLVESSNAHLETKLDIFTRMTDIDNYILLSILSSPEAIKFANNLTDVMYCRVQPVEDTSLIRISHLPVIGAMAYLSVEQNREVMNDLRKCLDVAQMISSSLDNFTSIDVKFFNTYGVSKYFDVDTTDLRIRMSITLNVTMSKLIKTRLKDFISQYIESCNMNVEKRFSFSNLVSLLEGNFSEIKYIKFFNINGGNLQSVQQIKYLNEGFENLPIDYVPEFINVRKVLPVGETEKWYDYHIEIDF